MLRSDMATLRQLGRQEAAAVDTCPTQQQHLVCSVRCSNNSSGPHSSKHHSSSSNHHHWVKQDHQQPLHHEQLRLLLAPGSNHGPRVPQVLHSNHSSSSSHRVGSRAHLWGGL